MNNLINSLYIYKNKINIQDYIKSIKNKLQIISFTKKPEAATICGVNKLNDPNIPLIPVKEQNLSMNKTLQGKCVAINFATNEK